LSAAELTIADLARLAGVAIVDARRWLGDPLPVKLPYRRLEGAEHGNAVAAAEAEIARPDLRISGAGDRPVWERGWGGVLEAVRAHGFTLEALSPQYFRGQVILRLEGRYILAGTDSFVTDVDLALRRLLFHRHLADADEIVEFGCGTGLNILLLSEIAPRARLIGTDWSEASVEILALAARELGRPIRGARVDMRTMAGADAAPIGLETCVLTVHALEQLGRDFGPFLDRIMAARPRLCVHFEPLVELYDRADPFDARAARYHERRNYLAGFLPAVQQLAAQGRAEIVTLRRFGYGSHFHEAYNALVWRPI
jgi:SAM-dependent methyltransferase